MVIDQVEKREAHLLHGVEPLQINYPEGFPEEHKSNGDAPGFYINTSPRWLTRREIKLLQDFVNGLPYRQKLVMTGAVLLGSENPLLNPMASHDQLDQIERKKQLINSRFSMAGGERSPYERILIITESLSMEELDSLFPALPASK